MEKEKEIWRTVKIKVTNKTKEFFRYCQRNNFILSRKLTEIVEMYADFVEQKEEELKQKEKKEFINYLENMKGGENG